MGFGQRLGAALEVLLDGGVELLVAGQGCGGQFALFLVADIGIGVRLFEQRKNLVLIDPSGFVCRAGVAHDLDFLGEERGAVGLLDEEAEPQQVEGGQPAKRRGCASRRNGRRGRRRPW